MSRDVQQNLIRVNPDGTISAVFPGGVIIPELVPQVTLDEDKQVSWVRNSDNALVAQVRSATFVGSQEFDFFTQNPDNSQIQAGLVAVSGNTISGGSQVYAFANDDAPRNQLREIIKSDGTSDFVQLSSTGIVKVHGPFTVSQSWPGAAATGFSIGVITGLIGIIIISTNPASHFVYRYFPRVQFHDFVIYNEGAAQVIDVTYLYLTNV